MPDLILLCFKLEELGVSETKSLIKHEQTPVCFSQAKEPRNRKILKSPLVTCQKSVSE